MKRVKSQSTETLTAVVLTPTIDRELITAYDAVSSTESPGLENNIGALRKPPAAHMD